MATPPVSSFTPPGTSSTSGSTQAASSSVASTPEELGAQLAAMMTGQANPATSGAGSSSPASTSTNPSASASTSTSSDPGSNPGQSSLSYTLGPSFGTGGAGTGADVDSKKSSTNPAGSLPGYNADAGKQAVSQALSSGSTNPVVNFAQSLMNASGGADMSGMSVQMIIQMVLMDAYKGTQDDLKDLANRYKYFNKVKQNVRDELGKARAALATADNSGNVNYVWNKTADNLNPSGKSGVVTITPDAKANPFKPLGDTGNFDYNTGKDGLSADGKTILTKNALSAYCDKLDQDLDAASDNSSEVSTKVQALTSAQQQLLSMITQLIKNWSDTSMSIIHNI